MPAQKRKSRKQPRLTRWRFSTRDLQRPDGARLDLIRAVVAMGARHCAIVGAAPALHMLAMLKGIVTRQKCAGPNATRGRIHLFHWAADLWRWRELLRRIDPGAVRLALDGVVAFTQADENGRAAWIEAVRKRTEGAHPPYDVVLHTGAGAALDIRGDLQVLWPAMGPDTIIILCSTDTKGTRRQADRMRRDHGWDAIDFGQLMLLQRPDHARREEPRDGSTRPVG